MVWSAYRGLKHIWNLDKIENFEVVYHKPSQYPKKLSGWLKCHKSFIFFMIYTLNILSVVRGVVYIDREIERLTEDSYLKE